MDSPPENDVCSVCHERFTLPCQANCSHWFCGSCIMRVWHHGSALGPCKCPICRRLITLLIPSETAQSQRHEPGASQILENIEKYNRSFGGGSHSIMQRLWDLPFFTRRLLRELMDPHRSLPLIFRARMIFAPYARNLPFVKERRRIPGIVPTILYVLSPIDIIPEGVFGLVGLFDDLLVLLIVFLHLAAIYRSILLYRHGGQ